jgi:putative DNA methylase
LTFPIKIPKKLIEVALPLDDINEACIKEKSIRHGHPSTLHLWWARRPLAAARAVIFAQMVNDPGYERSIGRGVNKQRAQIERERLFGIIRKLVLWENTNDEEILEEARTEIRKSWRETCELNRGHPNADKLFNLEVLPSFHDPFAGGGALPLEAQRLGLESYASDLNPVAVMINKAVIEIPPRFAGSIPLGPPLKTDKQVRIEQDWSGSKGLAEDVRRYGAWIREEAFKRIGHLYPNADLPNQYGGGKANVIAWIWARTVKSPNPAFSHVDVPLVSSFILSSKEGRQVYVKPVINGDSYSFAIENAAPPKSAENGTKSGGRGSNFICILSGTAISGDYVKEEGKAGRIGARLMAIVVEAGRGRVYLQPTQEMEAIALSATPSWRPENEICGTTQYLGVLPYGMHRFDQIFTNRQLVALTTFSDLVIEVKEKIKSDAISSGMRDDGVTLADGGCGATAYADAVSVYLGLATSKMSDAQSTLCRWKPTMDQSIATFGRQAIPMVWDYSESNAFSGMAGDFAVTLNNMMRVLDRLIPCSEGHASQHDAQSQNISQGKVISTDPPYYDNVPYADISDYFYVWIRRALRSVYPNLFSTMAVPKAEELVAARHRQGSKEAAEIFFLNGMTQAMRRLSDQASQTFPTTIYYAFKQADTNDLGTGNTGWETFLEAVLRAGFSITGTWPMRTELSNRMRSADSNALASSIVLVCRKRAINAESISRRDFLRELKEELAESVELMIGGAVGISPVAPVDLAQAVIGPGMAIFSKYSAVLEADGSPMTVHSALTLINRMLTEGADDFDADTQFCLGWFDEQGWAAGEFGKADVLTRAKGTSVDHVKSAGVVEASAGKVRLLKPVEYPINWLPKNDNNTPVWEALHQLIRELRAKGESAAGTLLAGMPQRAGPIRNLAYRLYTLCERKGWADDARAYNELITSWTGIEASSQETGQLGSQVNLDI